MAILLDQVIETDYGQLDLCWDDADGFDGDFDRFFAGQVNGIVGAAATDVGVYVNLARRSGGSAVRLDLLDQVPDQQAIWEDVVEVSVTVPAGAAPHWSTWAGEESGPLAIPAGSYRLRVSARGRDAGRDDELAEDVVDFYLLELWSATPEPDVIMKIGSEDAAYWHHEVGNRR